MLIHCKGLQTSLNLSINVYYFVIIIPNDFLKEGKCSGLGSIDIGSRLQFSGMCIGEFWCHQISDVMGRLEFQSIIKQYEIASIC